MIERTFGEGSIPRLFIMDRGYSSTNLFAHISVMKNTYFLIRLKKNWANIMKKLPQNQEYDITLEITITTSKKDLLHHPDDGTIWMYVAKAHYNHRKKSPNWDFENKFHLKLRFVSVCINPDKEDGDPNKYEYLVTNLPDCPYTTAKLKKYYSMRWGIETSYRDLKYAVDLVDFHSNDQELIRQEIYAAFIRYNFSMFIIKLAINKLAKKLRGKYEYSPRRATAFDMCQQYLKEAWIKSPEGGRLIPRMLKILEPIRPDRPDRRKAVHQKPAKGFTYRNAA